MPLKAGDATAGAAQHSVQPRQDDIDVPVLAHEGVCPGVERADLGAAVLRTGQQQAGQPAQRRVEANAADNGCAVDTWQLIVHDHGARVQVGGKTQALLAASGKQHMV